MVNLTANQESFIKLMTKSDEHAHRGFELLLSRPGIENYFDALIGAGLFEPTHNPAPAPAEETGYFRIPYWSALSYMEAVAKVAGERNDLQLAQKILNIVRSVSSVREPDGRIRDNYHTHRVFAKILGLVPTAAITVDDLNLIPGWLEGRFERGMVGHALGQGALRKLLASELPEDWHKACLILQHCTAVQWVNEHELGEDRKKPVTIVEDHWLKKLITENTEALGAKIGHDASVIFLERIRAVFGQERRDEISWLWRPAIEEHPQNHSWRGPENRFVEGLRDVLLSWVDCDPDAARPFVEELLSDKDEIVRRIGIYILNQRWSALFRIFPQFLGRKPFDAGHIHELYGLLRDHFDDFNDGEKVATIEAIRQLPKPLRGEDPDRLLKYIQRNWLFAIAGKGYEPADRWFSELMADQSLGSLSDHPDFHSYMESWSGPGPTPYQPQELLAFAENGTLIEKLNAFQPSDTWRGPTTRALVDTLEEAVGHSHRTFLSILPAFINAKRPFQYGVISGLKRIWDSSNDKQPQMDWERTWNELMGFLEQLVGNAEFWTEKVIESQDLTPNRDWIPPLIADFLRAGTHDDNKAYPPNLLPRAWSLICLLLERSEAVDEARVDAMTQAINSSKGKVIEAMFSHALRACRASDRANGQHTTTWNELRPTFERELSQCKNANYEFSTLAGAYLANLDYLDRDWLRANIEQIFPSQFPQNLECALEGLAYAPALRPIYALLVERGILDAALRQEQKGKHARERIVERIALAYLWGDDELDSSRFSYLFESSCVEDIENVSRFFWSVSNQELTGVQVERIMLFWRRCAAWSQTAGEPPKRLLSNLSRLSCYLETVGDNELELLLGVAPHVQVGYNQDSFIEELDRLVTANPEGIGRVLRIVLETHQPSFDFEDKLKSLLLKLAEHGRRGDAISFAERLRNLPGMIQLYAQLVSDA